MAKLLPHWLHLCFDTSAVMELIFALPSLLSMESTVKDLIEKTGEESDDDEETEDTSDVAGDKGGDMEHSLEQDLKLRSRGCVSSC